MESYYTFKAAEDRDEESPEHIGTLDPVLQYDQRKKQRFLFNSNLFLSLSDCLADPLTKDLFNFFFKSTVF